MIVNNIYVDGIKINHREKLVLVEVEDLTNDLKGYIKKLLAPICFGNSVLDNSYDIHNYQNTLYEFIERFKTKDQNTQMGMIGELLAHVVTRLYFHNLETVSPFFNSEERNIKKGFDVIMIHTKKSDLWIAEVKSGKKLTDKNTSRTTTTLLNRGKNDLVRRLAENKNQSLWLNAINGAKLTMSEHSDMKNAVIDILDSYNSNKKPQTSHDYSDFNILLVSCLFHTTQMPIQIDAIHEYSKSGLTDMRFNDFFLLVMQKSTYEKIANFLKEEANG